MFNEEFIDYDFPYGDHDWGMYRYNGMNRKVIEKLLSFSTKWGDLVHVCCYCDNTRHRCSDNIFDFDNAGLYLYYRQGVKVLSRKVESDLILSRYWSDTDSYTFEDDTVKELVENEKKTIPMLKEIIRLGKEFNEMVYNEK